MTPARLRVACRPGTPRPTPSQILGIALGGVLGERFGLSAAIVFGVLGGLFSFLWLWFSPVPRLRSLPDPGGYPAPR